MITEHSVHSFSVYLSYFFLSFLQHFISTYTSAGKHPENNNWPFCTNLEGFSKSTGWSVIITTLPVILSSEDRVRQSQVAGPEATKARTFCFQDTGTNLWTAHWWSYLRCWEVIFLLQSSSQFLAPSPLTTPHLSYLPLSPFSLFSSSLARIWEFATTISVNLQSLI